MTELLATQAAEVAAFDLALHSARGRFGDRALWCAVAVALAERTVPAERVASWFRCPVPLPQLLDPLRRARDAGVVTALGAGAAYERRLQSAAHAARRDRGVYFTPRVLAEYVVEQTLAPVLHAAETVDHVLAVRLCDPAAGTGAFVLPALDALARRAVQVSRGTLSDAAATRAVVENCVYAVDADPTATALLRALLCAHVDAATLDVTAVERHVVTGDSLTGPPPSAGKPVPAGAVAWERAFPLVFADGGFTAVVGNPPWGPVKAAARHRAGGEQSWRQHRDRKQAYVAALREAGYAHQGAGDTDLYRYFVERSHQILRPDGRLGVIVPSALERAEGAAPLRRLLFGDGTFELLLDFVNARRLFDIHPMFRFVVLVWQQGRARGITRAAFGLESVQDARRGTGLVVSRRYLDTVSGERLSVPDVRRAPDAALFERVHRSHPPCGSSDSAWRVRYARELDMSNDADQFVHVSQATAQGAVRRADGSWTHPKLGTLLPVYEGRMVHQFDAAAKRYVRGSARSALWEPLVPGEKGVHPQYLVAASAAGRGEGVSRAAFCDVTGHANERSVLAALVPGSSVCGNKVPTCRFESSDKCTPLLWLAFANSFVVDWLVRRRVSTTLNFFVWEQVPLPAADPTTAIGAALVDIAQELCEPAESAWAVDAYERRAPLRAAADALVAEAYGLDLRDMAVILADFPLLDRHTRGYGIHTTVTRDLVLQACASRQRVSDIRLSDLGIAAGGGPDRVADRVVEAAAAGEVAYVPGEVAAYRHRAARAAG